MFSSSAQLADPNVRTYARKAVHLSGVNLSHGLVFKIKLVAWFVMRRQPPEQRCEEIPYEKRYLFGNCQNS